jgi:hypothetical protein
MTRRTLVFALLVVFALTGSVYAQATRTWVSGVGDDANPCSRTAPCKTFAGAISKTAVYGEISVLDPGGFGNVTITKSMTIDGTGQIGSDLNATVNGIIINCSGCEVTLRNMEIDGAGSGVRGVDILQAKAVHITGVAIWGQRGNPGRGIDIATSTPVDVFVDHTNIWDVASHAIANVPSAGAPNVRLFVSDCVITDNSGGTGDAFFLNNGVKAVISRTFMGGFASAGIEANNSEVTASDNVINACGNGAFATGTGIIRLDRNTITNNTISGFNANSGGQVQSSGDNYWANNGANTGVLGAFLKQ